MNSKRLITVLLAAALMFCLFTGCESPETVSPSPESPLPDTTTPPPADSPSPSPAGTPGNDTPSPTPTPTLPPVSREPIDFPELENFERTVSKDQVSYSHNEGFMTIVMNYELATPEQIEQAGTGKGPELETILDRAFAVGSTILSEKVIDLPGLDRKGLEMELDISEGIYGLGLVIPSEGQVITVLGVALEANEQDLKDAYDQLIQQLTV